MLLSEQIKQKINDKYELLKSLKAENKLDEALKVVDEIDNLKKELAIAIAEEEREKEVAQNIANNENEKANKITNINANRVFNKLITGQTVSDEEMNVYNQSSATGHLGSDNARGGFLLPKEQELAIYEFRRNLNSLKSLCRVKKVNTRSGTYNVEVADTLELLPFEELDNITEKNLTFAQKEWSVKDYGILHKISNTLLDDLKNTDVKIIDFIGRKFAKAAVRTENKKIAEQLKKVTPTTIKSHLDIKTALNVTLDPSISSNARIITNQTSFNYLDRLVDGNEQPLLSDSLTEAGKKTFAGKTIEVFSDTEIESSDNQKLIFYVGDVEEYVTFYEREGLLAGISSDAGFTINATWTRLIERFGVDVVDDRALVCLEMAVPRK